MSDIAPKRVIGIPFPPGNPGRPKGARHKFSEAFVKALHDDFINHGASTIEKVRQVDPAAYLRVCASLMPKELELKRPLSDLSDDELLNAIDLIRVAIGGDPEGDGAGMSTASGREPASDIPPLH